MAEDAAQGGMAQALNAAEPATADASQPELNTEGEGAPAKPEVIQLPDGITTATLIEFARKRKSQHRRWFGENNGYGEKITDWWRAYDGKLMPGQKVNTTVPICHSVVETDFAKTMQSLLSQAKVVDAMPLAEQPNNENKETIEDLVNQEVLWSLARTQEKLYSGVKGCKIEGTGIGRVEWEKRFIETIPPPVEFDPITNKQVQTKTVAEVKVFKETHGPNWNIVSLLNVGWDHRVASNISDSEWVFEMFFPDKTDLLLMRDAGKISDIQAIIDQPAGADLETADPEEKLRTKLAPGGTGPEQANKAERVWKLDEWHGWVPFEATDGSGWTKAAMHFFIVNETEVVMAKPDEWVDETGRGPVHPYFSFRQELVPRQMLGKSVHDSIMDLQVYVNNLQGSNQKLIHKAATNPVFVSRAAGLDTLRLFTEELSVIPVLDASQVKSNPIDAQAIQAVTNERAWNINMARETVAANELSQAIPRENMNNATATEASILNANSGLRFQVVVDLMKHEIYGNLARLFWWSIRQWFKEGDLVVRESSLDGAPKKITRADLVDDYLFVPITSAMVNETRAQLQEQMQLAQQMLAIQQAHPEALVNDQGIQFRFSLFDFMVEQIFPKMGIRNGHTFLKPVSIPPVTVIPGQPLRPAAPPAPPRPLVPGPGGPPPPLAPAPQFQALPVQE